MKNVKIWNYIEAIKMFLLMIQMKVVYGEILNIGLIITKTTDPSLSSNKKL